MARVDGLILTVDMSAVTASFQSIADLLGVKVGGLVCGAQPIPDRRFRTKIVLEQETDSRLVVTVLDEGAA